MIPFSVFHHHSSFYVSASPRIKHTLKWSPYGLGEFVNSSPSKRLSQDNNCLQRDESSPASFEKTLSALSIKIKNAVSKSDTLRQRGRRFNALWMLYSSFAYLLYTIVAVLVMGWNNLGFVQVGVLVGGPFLSASIKLSMYGLYLLI